MGEGNRGRERLSRDLLECAGLQLVRGNLVHPLRTSPRSGRYEIISNCHRRPTDWRPHARSTQADKCELPPVCNEREPDMAVLISHPDEITKLIFEAAGQQ